jgi:hypothetical protein
MANPNEFFLPPDEAQSLGNTEYMRKKVTIRRTFPITTSNKSGELIKEVSATTDRLVSKGGTFASNGNSSAPQSTTNNGVSNESSQSNQSVEPSFTEERRSNSGGMDMFRNMARQIRK